MQALAVVRAAAQTWLKNFACAAVRGGAAAAADVSGGVSAEFSVAMRAAAPTALNIVSHVTVLGGAVALALVGAEVLAQAAACWRPCAPPRAWGLTTSCASRRAAARSWCRTCRRGRWCRPRRPCAPPRARLSTFSRASPRATARWQQRTCLWAPTVQGLAAGLLLQDGAAARAAAYDEINIVPCVAVRGGAVAMVAVCAEAL